MSLAKLALLVGVCSLACCGRSDQPRGADNGSTPTIYTSFYPTKYFAERIGGEHIEVVCPLPADADPIFWQPTRDDIAAFHSADLIVLNGAGFEKWAEQAVLPDSRVLISAAPLEDTLIEFETTTHSHGPAGGHTHAGIDGHTWLDPGNAIVQAEQIRDALSGLFPEHADSCAEGFTRLRADLSALDAELAALDLDGVTVLCSHQAYNYIARRYGWAITNFDLDPAEPIDDQSWSRIIDIVGAAPGRVIMLWESPPLGETDSRLASVLGVGGVVFSPCEMLESGENGQDYLSVMHDNVHQLSEALSD